MIQWINERLDEGMGYREMFRLFRQAVICEALLRSGWRDRDGFAKTPGNYTKAARLMKVPRNSLGHWLKKLRTENGQKAA